MNTQKTNQRKEKKMKKYAKKKDPDYTEAMKY